MIRSLLYILMTFIQSVNNTLYLFYGKNIKTCDVWHTSAQMCQKSIQNNWYSPTKRAKWLINVIFVLAIVYDVISYSVCQ